MLKFLKFLRCPSQANGIGHRCDLVRFHNGLHFAEGSWGCDVWETELRGNLKLKFVAWLGLTFLQFAAVWLMAGIGVAFAKQGPYGMIAVAAIITFWLIIGLLRSGKLAVSYWVRLHPGIPDLRPYD